MTIEVKPDLKDGRWVGDHFIKLNLSWDLWECDHCGRTETEPSGYKDFECCPSLGADGHRTKQRHRVKALPFGSPMRWGCKDCSAEAKAITDLSSLSCDGPETTQVHSGPAAFLCGVGSGHVCGGAPGRFEELLDQMRDLHQRKRSDYTGTSGDLLWNYRNSAKLAGITTAQGMFSRLCEKVVRISSVMSKGGDTQVTDEGLKDTFFDLAVISLLCIIESEERA